MVDYKLNQSEGISLTIQSGCNICMYTSSRRGAMFGCSSSMVSLFLGNVTDEIHPDSMKFSQE